MGKEERTHFVLFVRINFVILMNGIAANESKAEYDWCYNVCTYVVC